MGKLTMAMGGGANQLDRSNKITLGQLGAAANVDKSKQEQQNADNVGLAGQSVVEIMNFISDNMNKAIQKKIRDVPEALPLIRRISHMNTHEDDLFKKVRVGQQNQNRGIGEDPEINCQHEEEVVDWKCKTCNNDVSKFDIIFDDTGGQVNRYTELLYENHFLSDFKHDFR